MLGLLLIYFIGKAFYDLSAKHNKSKWGFAILGIVVYYAGTFIGGIIMGIIDFISGTNFTTSQSNLVLNLLAIPFGLLFCWIFHKILKSIWNKKAITFTDDLLDSNLNNE
jgi:thiamine transporter ThiT